MQECSKETQVAPGHLPPWGMGTMHPLIARGLHGGSETS